MKRTNEWLPRCTELRYVPHKALPKCSPLSLIPAPPKTHPHPHQLTLLHAHGHRPRSISPGPLHLLLPLPGKLLARRAPSCLPSQLQRAVLVSTTVFLLLKILLIFRERRREKERERNIEVREKCPAVASRRCPDQGPNLRPRHVPDRKSNWRPFALGDDTQLTGQGSADYSIGNCWSPHSLSSPHYLNTPRSCHVV